MKVPNTFVLEKEFDSKIEYYLTKEVENKGLAIAVGIKEGSYHRGLLYVWYYTMREPKLVRKRDALIKGLYYSKTKHKLYDCGIYKAINDTLLEKEYTSSVVSIISMCEYDNQLIHSKLSEIYIDKKKQKVTDRGGWVESFEIHDGKIYDAGKYGVYEGLEKGLMVRHPGDLYDFREYNYPDTITMRALASHEGILYGVGQYTSGDFKSATIFNLLTKEKIAVRDREICALEPFGKMLLEGGKYGGITDALAEKSFLKLNNCNITALETIPLDLIKELIRTKTI